MFREVAGFEFRYQLKNPVLWVAFIVFSLLTFALIASDRVQIGGGGGNTHLNSPYSLTMTMGILSIFAQFAIVAFVANVVIRDHETGFAPIMHATRVKKAEYLFGRFTGALFACVIFMLAGPLGTFIGTLMPWVDQERLGPSEFWNYAYAFLVAGLPNLFITAALFFAVATATRSMMATYVALIAYFILFTLVGVFLNRPEFRDFATLGDPYGIGAIQETTRYWTVAERNTQLPPIDAKWLANRALWGGVGIAALAVAYSMFSFSTKGAKQERKKAKKKGAADDASAPILQVAGAARRSFGTAAQWSQLKARTAFEFSYVARGPAFIILLLLGLMNSGFGLWFADETNDVVIYPVTRVMVQTLNGAFVIFPIIIAIYYAGELVWRDREKRVHEIVDSTPAPDWTFAIPKVLALTLVLAASILVSVVAAVLVQTFKGFTDYNFHQYLYWYILPSLFQAFLLSALAIFLQVLSPHKFIGWGLMLLYLIGNITLSALGFDHGLYRYGSAPVVPPSEMNEFAHYWIGAAWFRAYWLGWALLLVLFAYTLWRRGAETRLIPRFAALPRRLRGFSGALALVLVAGIGGLGGWIFYNVNVLNPYESGIAGEQWRADMERALIRYDNAPQPKVTAVTLNVDLRPHAHSVTATGSYTIVNRNAAPISEIHLLWPRRLELVRVEVDGGALAEDFATHSPAFPFQIWRLATPMQPGEQREIRFTTREARQGFRISSVLTRINDNGAFINDTDITPFLGFTRQGLLSGRALRRRYGLPAEMRPPRLEDPNAPQFHYLRHDSDWVTADITVSTDADQIPIAPGYVVSDETANGRRTTRFRTEAPIMHFFSIQSARYSVRHGKWRDVDLAVYYDPHHQYNVDRMLRAMRLSLDTFSAEFSPFQFRQMRILEFPAYASFAQSFANTVPFSEGIGFIGRFNDAEAASETDKIDMVTYVTAHEIGHQWWAHQLIGAEAQGATMLSETFAQYSALLVMERMYGPEQVRRFLKFELDNYLRSRGSEAIEELPLMRVENQPYIHYRKGAVVMYFLRSEIGEGAVNRALRRLLAEFPTGRGAPYPRSSDFVRILREEAGPQHQALITDLFERITLYDAKVVETSATRRADGRWDVRLVVEARKFYADGEGKETEAPLDEPFEIGVFAAEPGRGAFTAADVILFERRPIRSGRQTIALTVDREPRFVGVDPYNKRIDRNSDDNLLAVARAGAASTAPPS